MAMNDEYIGIMKKFIMRVPFAIILLAFYSCSFFGSLLGSDFTGNDDTNHDTNYSTNYDKQFWGEWTRMDTGDSWYIDNHKITKNKNASDSSQITGVSLSRQSGRVIEVTDSGKKYYLYASRTANTRFSGSVANLTGINPSVQARAAGWLHDAAVKITNANNGAETTTTTDNTGKFTVSGAIAGDDYKIEVAGETITVTPSADGDNIGTITVAEGLNFKTGITSSHDTQRLYANWVEAYDVILNLNNVGDIDCTAARYDLTFDGDLTVTSGDTTGILRTIEPGKSREIPISLKCAEITDEHEFKTIGIRITDSLTGRVWNDSVSLKFNKAPIIFIIKAESVVQGVIISPSNKAYHFRTDPAGDYGESSLECSAAVAVPWSRDNYLIVFSGATADTETVYSFGINIPETSHNWNQFLDVMNYEPNNNEETAASINGNQKIISYLHKNDIDYYQVNASAQTPVIRTAVIKDMAYVDINNLIRLADDLGYDYYKPEDFLYPGMNTHLDLHVKNISGFDGNNVNLSISSPTGYAAFEKSTGAVANMTASGIWSNATMTWGRFGFGYLGNLPRGKTFLNYNRTGGFKFTISDSCPTGIDIPFTITYTDSWGNTWEDTFRLPVQARN